MSSVYPEDEFDHLDEDGPVGVHRKPPSRWRPVVPFLVVLVAAPLLAWGVSYIIENGGPSRGSAAQSQDRATPQSSPSNDQSGVQSQGNADPLPSAEPSTAPNVIDSPEPTPAADIDQNVSISVLNASGVSGYAAEQVTVLQQAGFPNAVAGNTQGWAATENTVYYAGPEHAASAQKVAQSLGITAVVENPDVTADASIVVLLVQ